MLINRPGGISGAEGPAGGHGRNYSPTHCSFSTDANLSSGPSQVTMPELDRHLPPSPRCVEAAHLTSYTSSSVRSAPCDEWQGLLAESTTADRSVVARSFDKTGGRQRARGPLSGFTALTKPAACSRACRDRRSWRQDEEVACGSWFGLFATWREDRQSLKGEGGRGAIGSGGRRNSLPHSIEAISH